MNKITLATSAGEFLSNLPEGATGILVGDEYVPFTQFEKVEDDSIWLKDSDEPPPCDVCGKPSVTSSITIYNPYNVPIDISQGGTKIVNRCAKHQETTTDF